MKLLGRQGAVLLLVSGSAVLFSGCASDKYLRSNGHRAMESHDFIRAAEEFSKEASKPGTNQLLFMLDEASARFANHQYKETTEILLRAEKLAEIKDYTSISEEVGTLLTSDNVRGYKGEDFEKVLINVYLAMSYAAMGMTEDAQVEARKINLLLYRMINEGKRNYQESPFARYLSALMWESSRQVNDAYIDYKKTAELDSNFPDIGRDLISGAMKLGFRDEQQEWREKYPQAQPRILKSKEGEVIVFFEKGMGPVKIPRDGQDSSLPKFRSRWFEEGGARLRVDGSQIADAHTALDIDALSTKYLEDRIGRMTAAKLGGLATKAAIAYGVGKLSKDQDLGVLAFIALAASDKADLRSWKSLPATLEMARMIVPAGNHQVELEVLGHGGSPIRTVSFGNIEVGAGKKVFLMGR